MNPADRKTKAAVIIIQTTTVNIFAANTAH